MEIENANRHPVKVSIVKDADMYANSHPYQVAIVGGGGGGEARVVDELPETGEPGYIYLVLKEETAQGDIYDEWIWALQQDETTYAWEHLGTTSEVTITLYDSTGTNTDGAMTQLATTSMVYADPATKTQIQLGNSTSSGLNSVSAGNNITASGDRAIAIGDRTDNTIVTAGGASAISLGVNASATSQSGSDIAMGVRAKGIGGASIALGTYSAANSLYSQAIGGQATATGNYSQAIGTQATANGINSLAIGMHPNAGAQYSIAIGAEATTSQQNAIAIGKSTKAKKENSVVIGNSAEADSAKNIAIGDNVKANGTDNVIIGSGVTNANNNVVGVGPSLTISGEDSVVIGAYTEGKAKSVVAVGDHASTGAMNAVAIGKGTEAEKAGALAIGTGAKAKSQIQNVAIGANASATGYYSVALGAWSTATQQGEVSVGLDSGNNYGYNNSNYRLISGVYDGQSAHDVATYGQVISYSAINGAGAPTTATEGKYVGQLYYDTTNESMYFLKTIDTTTTPATYTWEALGSGGGGPTVVQSPGTSTTDVMSQNAVTSMVFADPSTRCKIQIGRGASASYGANGVAIGYGASSGGSVNASDNIAIGTAAVVASGRAGSVALGASSGNNINANGMVDIGSSFTSYGYNNTNYRLLTGLYDPQSDHDAATKGYVDPSTDSSAPTTSTVGRLGEIRIDTSTNTAYMCVSVDDVTPAYEWKQITA